MPRGSYIKAFLTGSVTEGTGAGGAASTAINVPLMAASMNMRGAAAGIQIWSVDLEIDATSGAAFAGDNKTLTIMLSQVTVTGEKYVNDRDLILKVKLHSELVTSGLILFDEVISKDFYPAVPFYGQQLHLGIVNTMGASATVYAKIWYSSVMMSQTEILQQLQNQLT